MKPLTETAPVTTRYSIEKHSTGWAVYDHVEGRFIETWLAYDEAQSLVDELSAPETEAVEEYEPFDGDYCHADHFHQMLRRS